MNNNTFKTDSGKQKFKAELPQILAALAAAASDTCVGIALSFSAVLIPQVLHEQANQHEGAIQISKEESSYIASVLSLIVIPCAFVGAMLMDSLGRTAVLKIGVIPTVIGWILIATSTNKWMLICGRGLSGIVSGLYTTSILVYITETSTPKYRGALLALGPSAVALGMFMVYLVGAWLHWRVFAWVAAAYTLIPFALAWPLPESPPWLISKNRVNQANNSLKWLKRYYTETEYQVENELSTLVDEYNLKKKQAVQKRNWKMFLQPTVYKPLLIVTGLCIFQQFSGSYIMLLYSVTFMQNVGTNVNPYAASIVLGATRFGMSIVTVWLMRYYKRRTLLIFGLSAMSICMGISALFTQWILEGRTTHNWVPVVMIPLFIVFAMISVMSIPFTFTSELFPQAARGVSQSICFMVLHFLMFCALESYYTLNSIFGGASGIQYFFGAVSLLGLVFCYVFVPETHGKKLSEIEDYFMEHSTYLSVKPKSREPIIEDKKLLNVNKY